MRGQFRIFPDTLQEQILPNLVTDEGETAFMRMLLQGDPSIVPVDGNFYLGLKGNLGVTEQTTLTGITDEVAVANGYARQPLPRNPTGWPTVDSANGLGHGISALVTFSAVAGDYDKAIWRLFMTSAASGSSGVLFSVSGPLLTSRLLTSGETFPVRYELYLE